MSSLHHINGFLDPKAFGEVARVLTFCEELVMMVRSGHPEGGVADVPEEGFAIRTHRRTSISSGIQGERVRG